MSHAQTKSLVIGAYGFLGEALTKKLIRMGHEVSAVYAKTKFPIHGLQDSLHIDDLPKVSNDFDSVFLLASYIPEREPSLDSKRLIETNVSLPIRVCQQFDRAKIIFASSVSVYGYPSVLPITEDSPFSKPSPYGVSKLAGEFIVKQNPRWEIIRFSSIFGSHKKDLSFLHKMVKLALNTKKLSVWGDGQRAQDYIHVEDAAEHCLLASQCQHNYLSLGVAGRSYKNIDIIKILQELIGDLEVNFAADQDQGPSFIYDNSNTKKVLGDFSTARNLKDEIKRLIDFERQL